MAGVVPNGNEGCVICLALLWEISQSRKAKKVFLNKRLWLDFDCNCLLEPEGNSCWRPGFILRRVFIDKVICSFRLKFIVGKRQSISAFNLFCTRMLFVGDVCIQLGISKQLLSFLLLFKLRLNQGLPLCFLLILFVDFSFLSIVFVSLEVVVVSVASIHGHLLQLFRLWVFLKVLVAMTW